LLYATAYCLQQIHIHRIIMLYLSLKLSRTFEYFAYYEATVSVVIPS